MKRLALATALLLASLAAAQAFGLGREGFVFGRMGFPGGKKAALQPTGDILLVDGVSLILQTDAASFICRAGGC